MYVHVVPLVVVNAHCSASEVIHASCAYTDTASVEDQAIMSDMSDAEDTEMYGQCAPAPLPIVMNPFIVAEEETASVTAAPEAQSRMFLC